MIAMSIRISDGREFTTPGHYRNEREVRAAAGFYQDVLAEFPHINRLMGVNERGAAIQELAKVLNDGSKAMSLNFDVGQPRGHYRCPRCHSEKTQVVQPGQMWCEDCRNDAEPRDWIDRLRKWYAGLSDAERRFFGILSLDPDDGEHFYQCPHCGQAVDKRDVGQLLRHEMRGHERLAEN